MSKMVKSNKKSLSSTRIRSPILKGNVKNKITPAVMLLKIDHCANIATPMMAKTEEKTMDTSLKSTPQTNRLKRMNKMTSVTFIYLIISFVRFSKTSVTRLNLRTNFSKTYRIIRKITIRIIVCTKSVKWESINALNFMVEVSKNLTRRYKMNNNLRKGDSISVVPFFKYYLRR